MDAAEGPLSASSLMMESLMACGRRLTTRQGKEHNAAWAAICADRDGAACPQKSGAKAARMAFAHVPGMPMERDNPAGAPSLS